MSFLFGMGDEEDDDDAGMTIQQLSIDDDLPPLERLLKYTKSEIALQRLVHVKAMADTVRQVGFEASFETLSAVMAVVVKDEETDVKLTLAEQVGTSTSPRSAGSLRACALVHPCRDRVALSPFHSCSLSQIGDLATLFLETGGDRGYEETHSLLLSHVTTLLTDTQAAVRQAAGTTLVNIAPHLRKEHLVRHARQPPVTLYTVVSAPVSCVSRAPDAAVPACPVRRHRNLPC